MIKKFVSNALLSMVVDKKARDKLNAAQDQKTRKATPAPEKTQRRASAPAPADDLPAPRPSAASHPPAEDEDTAALIREALESAELELIEKRERKPMTSERQALIDQALAIHKAKSHVLDDLDQEDRDKLTFMAMKALDPKFGE